MAYDDARGVSVLFGGQAQSHDMLNDTWLYSGRRWQRAGTSSSKQPTPRCGHALTYDESSRVVVLFGGAASIGASLGDTWTFDGAKWRQVRGAGPSARRYAAMGYDPALKGCLLNGGSADDFGQLSFGDTWLFRDDVWTPLSTKFDVAVRDDHGVRHHRKAGRMVLSPGLGEDQALRWCEPSGWATVSASPTQPKHQCAPMVWDDSLDGLVVYGGEQYHEGPQSDVTRVLRFKL
jgi:hypothetical protein